MVALPVRLTVNVDTQSKMLKEDRGLFYLHEIVHRE
jgi:hypothetical protein